MNKLSRLTTSVQNRIQSLNNTLAKKAKQQTDQLLAIFDGILLKLILGILSLLILTLIISTITSKSITKPTQKMLAILKEISKGKIPNTKLEDSGDELGQIALAINDIMHELRKIILKIKASSDELAQMRVNFNQQAKTLTNDTDKQIDIMSTVSDALTQIKTGVNDTKKNAENAEEIVVESVNKITENHINVKQTVDALQKISERITVISDLAFQTNILSLNASIEASRAGKFGKGFSVVATEVGMLAERSRISSDDIEDLSSTSIKTAKYTVNSSASLVPEIQEAEQLVQLVKKASTKLKQDINRIDSSITALNLASQNSSLFALEITNLSEDLEDASDDLIEAISFFKFEDEAKNSTLKNHVSENKIDIEANDFKDFKDFKTPKVPTSQIPIVKKETSGVKLDLGDIPDDDFEVF